MPFARYRISLKEVAKTIQLVMSKTRALIADLDKRAVTTIDDYNRILDEWDIPLNETITALEANYWLRAQIICNEQCSLTCDGMSPDEWDEAVEFVWRCLKRGVVAHEYVWMLIDRQQTYDDCSNEARRVSAIVGT